MVRKLIDCCFFIHLSHLSCFLSHSFITITIAIIVAVAVDILSTINMFVDSSGLIFFLANAFVNSQQIPLWFQACQIQQGVHWEFDD